MITKNLSTAELKSAGITPSLFIEEQLGDLRILGSAEDEIVVVSGSEQGVELTIEAGAGRVRASGPNSFEHRRRLPCSRAASVQYRIGSCAW